MKRSLLVFAASLAIVVLHAPRSASAHFPATDKTITAILHAEPNDALVAGQPGTLDFIFEDMTNRLQLAKCSCNLSVSRQGQILFYGALTATQFDKPTIYGGGVPYTFPSAGIYQIKLVGAPNKTDAFQPFNLTWNLAVNQAPGSKGGISVRTLTAYFIAILGVFVILGLIFFLFA